MYPVLPQALDLWAVRQLLLDRGQYKDVVGLIGQARLMQGCAADLREAMGYLDALRASLRSQRRGSIPAHKMNSEAALLSMLTILYARATHDGSEQGARGSSQIRSNLTDEQRADHDSIIAVRRKAIAHVHHGELVDDDQWHAGLVMLIAVPQGYKAVAAGNRIQFNPKLYQRLARQLPVASTLMDERAERKLDEMSARVNELSINDEQFRGLLATQPVSLADVYGSRAAALEALAQMEAGARHATFRASTPR